MAKQPKPAKASKAEKKPKPAKADDGLVDAVVARDFTSTALGNLSTGQTIRISPERAEVWKDQKLVK